MSPTISKIKAEAVDPYLNNEISQREALDNSVEHLREFMFRQIENARNEEDIYLFLEYAEGPIGPNEVVVRRETTSSSESTCQLQNIMPS